MLRVPDVHQMATFTPVREEKTERKGERERTEGDRFRR